MKWRTRNCATIINFTTVRNFPKLLEIQQNSSNGFLEVQDGAVDCVSVGGKSVFELYGYDLISEINVIHSVTPPPVFCDTDEGSNHFPFEE